MTSVLDDKVVIELLCQKITRAVGERASKSESYIDCGDYISGETKVALILRLLGGGSSYDIKVIFDFSFKTCYNIWYHVLQHWIINTGIGKINMSAMASQRDRMDF